MVQPDCLAVNNLSSDSMTDSIEQSVGSETVVDLLGVRINCESYESLASKVLSWIERGEKRYCCFTNPHSIVMCQSDEEFKSATNGSSLTLADGVGVIYASRMLRLPLKERVTGPTSMLRIIEAGLDSGVKHYFYGSSEQTLEALRTNLQSLYPGIKIVGTHSPPFRQLSEAEVSERIQAINEAEPDILWIGLGAPKQEKWVADHLSQVTHTVTMAVGAAFDYHAGTVKWAPKFVRRLGIEWAYRLAQQPRRLFCRNLNSVVFLLLVLKSRFL